MPEPLLVMLGVAAAGLVVLAPLRRRSAPDPTLPGDELEAATIRHRVALEALRDLEADHRAGSLDEVAYAEQLAQAEGQAVATRAELDTLASRPVRPQAPVRWSARGYAIGAAAVIGLGLVVGSALPATGLANETRPNEQLAAAQEAEAARQARIGELLQAVAADPRDAAALSKLADAYLAGSSHEDLVRAAVTLTLLIDAEPQRADAYERLLAAYLRAGDYANARRALESYAALETADEVEVAFFDGLIALRGEGNAAAARAAFDRFLELAPDDPRAGMIRALRDEAADDDEPAEP